MSEPYIPDDGDVKFFATSDGWSGLSGPEFDRWLAGVKAEAWDEGAGACSLNIEYATGPKDEITNPYRKGNQ